MPDDLKKVRVVEVAPSSGPACENCPCYMDPDPMPVYCTMKLHLGMKDYSAGVMEIPDDCPAPVLLRVNGGE